MQVFEVCAGKLDRAKRLARDSGESTYVCEGDVEDRREQFVSTGAYIGTDEFVAFDCRILAEVHPDGEVDILV